MFLTNNENKRLQKYYVCLFFLNNVFTNIDFMNKVHKGSNKGRVIKEKLQINLFYRCHNFQ